MAAAPFLIYLFATVENYQRSLRFIIGIGNNALPIFIAFLNIVAILVLGIAVAYILRSGQLKSERHRRYLFAALALHFLWLILLAFSIDLTAFWNSVVVNMVDQRTSPLIDPDLRPLVLTAQAQATIAAILRWATVAYVIGVGILLLAPMLRGRQPHRYSTLLVILLNGLALAFLLLVAHLEFATGLFVTIRATVIAYFIAAILGLVLAGMLGLTQGPKTLRNYAIVALILGIASAALFTRQQESYVLVGEVDQRIAIIKGTPKRLSDAIRFGNFPAAVEDRISIRSAGSVERALELQAADNNVSGALIPGRVAPPGLSVIWQVDYLPDRFRTIGIMTTVFGGLLLALLFAGWQSGVHPLAVFAEFFVDVVRGVPMLVIILYIGLPLSGAVKDASNGVIDLPNMIRGMIAISIGYSAFMAEIIRAGIEAIPRGQIEAARSIGMSRWHTSRLVVLPQALKIVIPPLGNEFIAMLKDTSLLSILSVRDLTQRTREFQAASFLPFAPFNTVAILYVVLTLAASSMLKWVERRTDVK
ncbi:MAG: amino acid ABC transporter permease [Alphaproteobacteria bacterium]